jgi:DNA repair photolyase
MQYKQIKVDTVINKITSKDNLFGGDYTVDPYQNCEYGCSYCDSSFDKTIYIKNNAPKIFEKEIKQIKNGTIIIGSVHDPYQKAEEKHELTKQILKIIKEHELSCHILTKSNLVLRDIDLISQIKESRVTVSITSQRPEIYQVFEKNVPKPDVRFKTIETLANHGINTGLALIPVLPYLIEPELEEIIKKAKQYKAGYLLYKHLELKGDQKNIFMDVLKKYYRNFINRYIELYAESYEPKVDYVKGLSTKLKILCKRHELKCI